MSTPSKPSNEKINNLRKDLDETQRIMKENVQKTVERGVRLEELEDITKDLEANSRSFKKQSKQLRLKMCWQDYKMTIIISLIVLVVLAFFLWLMILAARS